MEMNRRTGPHGCREFTRLAQLSRRRVVQAGALGFLGLSLPGLFAAQAVAEDAAAPASGFGRAKRCIFLFMWGGPSQLDTFDPKPDAPVDIRGEFRPISTNVPGIQICEHFGRVARVMDKICVIRSLCPGDAAQLSSGHASLTGHLAPVVRSDVEPPSERDSPHIGSVVARLRPGPAHLPSFVTMPWLCYHPAAPGGHAPGQDGGWLGKRYSPLLITGDPNDAQWRTAELSLLDSITLARLENRRDLLQSIDSLRAGMDPTRTLSEMDAFQEKAFSLLGSPAVRKAFDLSQESPAMRDLYGRNTHGQCVLLARRLVEHGVPIVSVNWHNDGKFFWDTHGNNFNRLKNDLIPPADQALAALLTDLDERGLLEDTLVCWVGEFGRKPQITAASAGREHWPGCYCGLLAGAGIRGGTVFGVSDNFGARPARDPVSPLDYAATVYHALGIRPNTTLPNRLERPIEVCQGTAITKLWAHG
jgi:hypothetical protein